MTIRPHLSSARRAFFSSCVSPRWRAAAVAALAAAALAGCAADNAMFPAPAEKGGSAVQSFPTGDPELQFVSQLPSARVTEGAEDALAPGDILQMEVFGVEKLSRTLQVDPRGWATFPLIGQMRASGRSVSALEREITAAYGRNYLRSPSITLTVKESPSRRVVVDGEVTRSGVFPVTSRTTLMEAIAQAGGFSQIADPSKVFVYRTVGGRKYVANYDVNGVREGKSPNPQIVAGDVVVVFSSSTRVAWQNVKDFAGVARSVVGGALVK